jgi:hypothetical protein
MNEGIHIETDADSMFFIIEQWDENSNFYLLAFVDVSVNDANATAIGWKRHSFASITLRIENDTWKQEIRVHMSCIFKWQLSTFCFDSFNNVCLSWRELLSPESQQMYQNNMSSHNWIIFLDDETSIEQEAQGIQIKDMLDNKA